MKFKDKVVIVTGASRNTGWGIAKKFLEEGACVALNGSSPETTSEGAFRLRELGFNRILEVPADVGDKEQVAALYKTVLDQWGCVDILVNNACDQGIGPTFSEISCEQFERVIQTNLLGTFYMGQQAARIMIQQGFGVIVNFSSNVSMRAIRNRSAYCSSKGGIDGLTRAMALDLAPYGIRVNSVAPGYIYTDRWDRLDEGTKQRRRLNIPSGKEATYEEVADLVFFLASDDSRGITGERFVIDGGTSIQNMPRDVEI